MTASETPQNNSSSTEDRRSESLSGFEFPLTSIFRRNCVQIIRPAMGKSSVISLLVETLAREEHIKRDHAEGIVAELLQRESHGTSAIGKGLAFPHLRTHDVEHFVGAIGVAPDGVNFGALDAEPTKLVFLTLSPWADRERHMALLSRLVSLMQDKAINMQLHHQIQPEDVYEYLIDLDNQSQTQARATEGEKERDPGRN
jgi:nitrogen PTS system EIIA component